MADLEMSSSGKEPCGACILKCLGVHSLSRTFSFYKVMAGNFSSELEFPLQIATRTKSSATDVILTGPNGHLWRVSFCCTGISASFRDGWRNFVCDNGIVAGDILVFRHVVNMHFIVQVFEAGHCGKEYTVESYTSCCREGILSELCRQKSFKHRKTPTKVSVAPVNFVPHQEKYKGTEYKSLLVAKEQNFLDIRTSSLSYEEIRKMLYNTENSISQNQVPQFQKHPNRLVADQESTSCSVTNDDSESIPVFSFCNTKPPMFSAAVQKSAVFGKGWFTIPKVFADKWLPKKDTELILLHHKNPGMWRIMYKTDRHGFVWKKFVVGNNMHQGDKCAFELINTVNHIFKVYVMS